MAKQRSGDAFPEYIKVTEPNFDVLSALTVAAQGERGLNEFSRECGVSASTLSRIINKKITSPCTDAVIRAIAEHAEEGSGVTLDLLLAAQGFVKVEVAQSDESGDLQLKVKDASKSVSSSTLAALGTAGTAALGTLFPPIGAGALAGTIVEAAFEAVEKKKKVTEREVEDQIRELIQNQLLIRGYSLSVTVGENIVSTPDLRYLADFVVRTNALEEDGIERWAFEVSTGRRPLLHKLNQVFGMAYVDSPSARGIKLSVVTTDREGFLDAKKRIATLRVHDDISVMLVDLKEKRIVEEVPLLRYDGKERVRVFD